MDQPLAANNMLSGKCASAGRGTHGCDGPQRKRVDTQHRPRAARLLRRVLSEIKVVSPHGVHGAGHRATVDQFYMHRAAIPCDGSERRCET